MSDLVEETLQGIRARLRELAPMVAEYERLEAAYAALDGPRTSSAGTRSGRSTSVRRRPATRPPARARRGENKRAVYAVIGERPGVTVAEIAAVTGIAKPMVYNTTRAGIERGELEKVALPGGHGGFRAVEGASF
jgi:hypothetical protein